MAVSVRGLSSARSLGDPIMMLESLELTCPEGQILDRGKCMPCPTGSYAYQGQCWSYDPSTPCSTGKVRSPQGQCITNPCKSGEVYRTASGTCVPAATTETGKGTQAIIVRDGRVTKTVADDPTFLLTLQQQEAKLLAEEASLKAKTDMLPFAIAGGAVALGLFLRMRRGK